MRRSDHVHVEYWSKDDQVRFEDRIADELKALRDDVKALSARMAWILGGLGVLVFVVNLAATLYLRVAR